MKDKAVRKLLLLATLALGGQIAIAGVGNSARVTADANGILKSNPTTSYKRFASDYDSLADVVKAEGELNKQIGAEGYTLLKNEGHNLPFSGSVRNISLFGKNSVDPVYSGSGSSGGTAGSTVTILQSLQNAGFHVNPTLVDFYKDTALSGPKHPSMGFAGYNYNSYFPTAETPMDKYTEEVKASYDKYKDAAVIVLARTGGEGTDLPRTSFVKEADEGKVPNTEDARAYPTFEQKADPNYKYHGGEGRTSDPHQHYLELDDNERALIQEVTKKFDKVVLLLDSVNVMELDRDLVINNDKVQSIIWAPGAGLNGFDAIGKILNGQVNPSARTSDTFAADFLASPANQNFGNNNVGYYNDGNAGNQYRTEDGSLYENNFDDFKGLEEVEYEEGIYTGYKYYETRGFTDGEEWYQKNVNYPFGYGLSYTDFEWTVGDIHMDTPTLTEKTNISVDVTVTNIGDYAGKDVVEMYYSAPYIKGGIEKSHVSLGDFAKTKMLKPLQSETLTLSMSGFDLASFDAYDKNANNHVGYEFDAGDYDFYIGKNAHQAWNGGTKRTIAKVEARNIDTDPVTGAPITAKFTSSTQEMKGHVLSRADWKGTFPSTPTEDDLCRSADFLSKFQMPLAEGSSKTSNSIATWYDEANPDFPDENGKPGKAPWYSSTAPTFRDKANEYTEENPAPIQLTDMAGVAFDDPKWNQYLSQFTVDQAYYLLVSQYSIKQLKALGIPYIGCADGTMGLAGAWVGTSYSLIGNAMGQFDYKFPFAPETVVACTFNKDIASEQGRLIGENGLWAHVTGWFAPGGNIHRSEFGGRNFEYYSEDAMLSAIMIKNVVRECTHKGMITYMKHFVLNDQETNRDTDGVATWADEQTMRENYFKVFEWGVKYGGSMGMMTSFNRVGFNWTGANYNLLTGLVRNEWGFKGIYVTDAHSQGQGCMDADQMIRCGNDTSLDAKGGTYAVLNNNETSNTPTQLTAVYNAIHRVCFAEANSQIMTYYNNVIKTNLAYNTKNIVATEKDTKPGEDFELSVSDGEEGARYTKVIGELPEGLELVGDKITGQVSQRVKAGTYKVTIAKLARDAGEGEGYLNSLSLTGGFRKSVINAQEFTIHVTADGALANIPEMRSVDGVRKIGTRNNVDYYEISYSDGTSSYFTIANGTDGKDGQNGKDGADGKDAETKDYDAKISSLEAEIDALKNKKSGCGGSVIAATSSLAAVVALAGALCLKKKKEEK